MISITPLEEWIREKACIGAGVTGPDFIDTLRDYQLQALNEIIRYARGNSPFYRDRLLSLSTEPLAHLSDINEIPFTSPSDIAGDPYRFLAVRQDDIARIVTLRTSGSTGESKRIFFTEDDLELTIDFFHRGMATLVRPGQRVAILLPGAIPDSVGDLLMRGLKRMNVKSLVYGPVADPVDAAQVIASFNAHCIVGIPTQVLAVAYSWPDEATQNSGIENVLLSTDYAPRAIERTLERIWGCTVFDHYGMTETGLGGGVECGVLDGYHLREADLYFEIVDRETGDPCPDGVEGEVVFTTLTRKGMPLIRYRTGDIARILKEPCPCGTTLRRMGRVKGRWDGIIPLDRGLNICLSDMDEALFCLPGLLDYRAVISRDETGDIRMDIHVHRVKGLGPAEEDVMRALVGIDVLGEAVSTGVVKGPTVFFSAEGRWATTGTTKRGIIVSASTLKTG